MAELINQTEVSNVRLYEIKVSEDELDLYLSAIHYILNNCADSILEESIGAYRDELEGIQLSLNEILNTSEHQLPQLT